MSHELIVKLEKAWALAPALRFGQLIESIENIAWPLYEQDQGRTCSARLMNLPDVYFEAALNQWIAIPFLRKPQVD